MTYAHSMRWLLLLMLASTILPACSGGNDDDDGPSANDDDDDITTTDDDDDEDPRLHSYADPAQLGPYPVGNITRVYEDTARDEPLTPEEGDHRTLMTEIWYPAAESAREMDTDTFIGFMGEWADVLGPMIPTVLGGDEEDVERVLALKTGSVRDADLADGGPFPIVLFSHGNGGLRFQSMFLCEYLASHGYVVISPDHTGNAAVSVTPTGLMLYNASTFADLLVRVADMRYLLDIAEGLDADDPDGRFTGRLDLDHVGMTGHSFGGMTTKTTVGEEPRIDVGAPMAGPFGQPEGITIPMMHFMASEDDTIDLGGNEQIVGNYEASMGPRWLVNLIDAGHFSFSDICLLDDQYGDGCGEGKRLADDSPMTYMDHNLAHRITNFYQIALFGYYLKGVEAYEDDLESNPFGSDVEYEFDRFP